MLVELTLWTMLTTSIHFYALLIDPVVYIEADQEKIYLIPEEEVKVK